MKKVLLILAVSCMTINCLAQIQQNVNTKTSRNMKMNAGILTEKLAETKKFYTEVLGFGVSFENEFYLLLHTPAEGEEISFLLPNHPTQNPFFHKPYKGEGMYLTIEVEDVDKLYEEIKKKGIKIQVEIRDEAWGDRHFAIQDPNGIGIDIVRYTALEEK